MKWIGCCMLIALLLTIPICFAQTSDTLSLNVNSTDIRMVFQQIAELAHRNIVVAQEVQGEVSLYVKDVTWQVALESVLETKQLQAIEKGNVIVIAPRAIERSLPPLPPEAITTKPINQMETRIIPLHFSNADAIAMQFQAHKQNYLSKQGSVSVDLRTNSVLVHDQASNVKEACELITALDIPVQQVMIVARVVNVQNNLTRELGIRWGLNRPVLETGQTQQWAVNLPMGSFYGAQTAFTMTTLPQNLQLDLELAALESEHLIEEVASPRIITINQQEALIRQGDEIPYQETSANGATSVSFRDAVLELRVTPVITYGNRILLKLLVKNDSRSAESLAGNIPVISTKEMVTQVILADGETVMLGGIYSEDNNSKHQQVPYLGDLPLIGRLFRNDARHKSRKEMLIFVTPRILNEKRGNFSQKVPEKEYRCLGNK